MPKLPFSTGDSNANKSKKITSEMNSNVMDGVDEHINSNNNLATTDNCEAINISYAAESRAASIVDGTHINGSVNVGDVNGSNRSGVGYSNGALPNKRTSSSLSLDKENGTCRVRLHRHDEPGPSYVNSQNVEQTCRRNSSSSCSPSSDQNFFSSSYSKRSSLSSNDDESMLEESDAGFVYTYRGDDIADLPDCFFVHINDAPRNGVNPPPIHRPFLQNQNVPVGNLRNNIDQRREFSPEMDFLEMDFDPGPSGELDEVENFGNENLESELELVPVDNSRGYLYENDTRQSDMTVNRSAENSFHACVPSTSGITRQEISGSQNRNTEPTLNSEIENNAHSMGNHESREKASHNDNVHLSTSHYQNITINGNETLTDTSIWTNDEVERKHIYFKQASSCVNASMNAWAALNFTPTVALQSIVELSKRYRQHSPDPKHKCVLLQFFMNKSCKFSSHKEVVYILDRISNGGITSRFFATFPPKKLALSHWLAYWLGLGIVPIVTMYHTDVISKKDCWQHRIIYSVTKAGIHATNPLERFTESHLYDILASNASLLDVDRGEILSNWNFEDDDLSEFMSLTDERWQELNVAGKCMHIIREHFNRHAEKSGFNVTKSVTIPIECQAGITLVCRNDNPNVELLRRCSNKLDDFPIDFEPTLGHVIENERKNLPLFILQNFGKEIDRHSKFLYGKS